MERQHKQMTQLGCGQRVLPEMQSALHFTKLPFWHKWPICADVPLNHIKIKLTRNANAVSVMYC